MSKTSIRSMLENLELKVLKAREDVEKKEEELKKKKEQLSLAEKKLHQAQRDVVYQSVMVNFDNFEAFLQAQEKEHEERK